jgi:hypothetical protein
MWIEFFDEVSAPLVCARVVETSSAIAKAQRFKEKT